MALFKSGNPTLDKETFTHCEKAVGTVKTMTISGTVNKTALLLLITMVAAYVTWQMYFTTSDPDLWQILVLGGSLLGLGISFFIVFNKDLSPYLAPLYAAFEGLALGGISAVMEARFPGIVIQSLSLTFGIFISLLVIYKLRIIKVTENFKLMIASGTAGIALYYLAALALGLFDIELPLIHESTTSGIIFSIFVVVLAAMNLVVDFDFIEQGAESNVPKYMEWYGAFGLLVTVIWLYIEILRLLAKSRKK